MHDVTFGGETATPMLVLRIAAHQFYLATTAARLTGLIAGQIEGVSLHPEDAIWQSRKTSACTPWCRSPRAAVSPSENAASSGKPAARSSCRAAVTLQDCSS